MTSIRRVLLIGTLVIGNMSTEAAHGAAQYVAVSLARDQAASPSVVYHCRHWVVDMRRNDGDPRRVMCLSGVFARDGDYYPFHDHIDDGSLQHVDRSFSDDRGGYYHQRGFVWTSFGDYRESTIWTHYCQTLPWQTR